MNIRHEDLPWAPSQRFPWEMLWVALGGFGIGLTAGVLIILRVLS